MHFALPFLAADLIAEHRRASAERLPILGRSDPGCGTIVRRPAVTDLVRIGHLCAAAVRRSGASVAGGLSRRLVTRDGA